jgi:hypothetical protein
MLLSSPTPTKSSVITNPQSRFVTKSAVAMQLKRSPEDIYKVNCWRYVVHVVGKKTSTFVSYADLPPIVGVALPNHRDVRAWRKRWKKYDHIAPLFWHNFYAEKLRQVKTMEELQAWEEVLSYIGFGLPESSRIELEGICSEMTHFLFSNAA